ncbi:MAG: hypothetical protein CBE43_11095 [Rhodopirellula sp. TMED283]|nr:MAG: hypothetical protein CBE43_11095 [Rhodopirellula sp. TMED283]
MLVLAFPGTGAARTEASKAITAPSPPMDNSTSNAHAKQERNTSNMRNTVAVTQGTCFLWLLLCRAWVGSGLHSP